jgi:hypothetical protein
MEQLEGSVQPGQYHQPVPPVPLFTPFPIDLYRIIIIYHTLYRYSGTVEQNRAEQRSNADFQLFHYPVPPFHYQSFIHGEISFPLSRRRLARLHPKRCSTEASRIDADFVIW